VNQLARAEALVHWLPPHVDGYEWANPGGFAVKDGSIRVYCYFDSAGVQKADFVRVILPVE
jgi:hypothetical protein